MCFGHLKTIVLPKNVRRSLSWSQNRFTAAGEQMAVAVYKRFWSNEHQCFAAHRKSAETIGPWNGYTLWPYTIGLEALLAAEATSAGLYAEEIHRTISGLNNYWHPTHRAYCAWHYHEGNEDLYYDDNAQVAIALLAAYALPHTRRPEYLHRAQALLTFLFTGEKPGGGVLWRLSSPPHQLNACSTNLSGIAALELNKIFPDQRLWEFGQRCSDFVHSRLQMPSGLVKDGPTGGPTWTYNTGAALTVCCLLGEEERAVTLAAAAIDRTKGMYDLTVVDPDLRFWWDQTYFVHLLIEGLVTFIETFGRSYEKLADAVAAEVEREAGYLLTELRDQDGLTWRNWRLYRIGEVQEERFKEICGEARESQEGWDENERWIMEGVEVGKRKLCKTLLGSAGSARALCIAGRLGI